MKKFKSYKKLFLSLALVGIVVVFTGCSLNDRDKFIAKTIEWGGTHGMFSCMATFVGKSEVFKACHFDDALALNEDLEWLLRAVVVDKYHFVYIPEVLANYRVSAIQASNTILTRDQLQDNNEYTWKKLNALLGEKVFPE